MTQNMKGKQKTIKRQKNKIDKMKERHQREIRELQENCPHKYISKWTDEWWAIAHSTGFQVKYCLDCDKIVKRRTTCCKCSKLTENYNEGDGSTYKPIGDYWCEKCFKELSNISSK